jgi:hypothetical protein
VFLGHVGPEESLTDSVVREMKEEIYIVLWIWDLQRMIFIYLRSKYFALNNRREDT